MEIFYVIVGGGNCVGRFHLKIKNVTKDKAGIEEVKTLEKSIFEVAEAVEKICS